MSNADSYSTGDRVQIVDGTFCGMQGVVIDNEEALALHTSSGGEAPLSSTYGFIPVALTLFGRRVSVNLQMSQFERHLR